MFYSKIIARIVPYITEDCLQRLTERPFYGVPMLLGLELWITFSGLPSSNGIVFRRGRGGVEP